jgi:hypothetical protein
MADREVIVIEDSDDEAPVRLTATSNEPIDLISDEDEPENDPPQRSTVLGKRKATAPPAATVAQDSDDDCVETNVPHREVRQSSAAGAGSSAQQDDDEDVVFEGRSGDLALADFPHARENCAVHPFAKDPSRKCPNCFCYVCDQAASECPRWEEHCRATHTVPAWRQAREAWRKSGGDPAKTAPAPAAAAAPVQAAGVLQIEGTYKDRASSATVTVSRAGVRYQIRFSHRPSSWSATLSGHTLSVDGITADGRVRSQGDVTFADGGYWALTSRAGSAASAGSSLVPVAQPARSENAILSSEALLKALEQVYPVEAPKPVGMLPSVVLRPYQKQSLAFMLDLERSTNPQLLCRNGRGGWLCEYATHASAPLALPRAPTRPACD